MIMGLAFDYLLNYLSLPLLFLVLAGYANKWMDTISFRWNDQDIPLWMLERNQFWNPAISWVNKWGDGERRERFPLSSTALVFLTDGWHLLKEIMLQLISLSISINYLLEWFWIGLVFHLVLRAGFGFGFTFMKRWR